MQAATDRLCPSYLHREGKSAEIMSPSQRCGECVPPNESALDNMILLSYLREPATWIFAGGPGEVMPPSVQELTQPGN